LNLDEFSPEDPLCFAANVTALIGPFNERGEELFQFTVCTPRWLEQDTFPKGYCWGRHYLFVSRWDAKLIMRVFRDLCLHAEGPDWNSVATTLSRYGQWEFEDYRESLSVNH